MTALSTSFFPALFSLGFFLFHFISGFLVPFYVLHLSPNSELTSSASDDWGFLNLYQTGFTAPLMGNSLRSGEQKHSSGPSIPVKSIQSVIYSGRMRAFMCYARVGIIA